MRHRLPCVPVRKVTHPSLAELAGPTCRGLDSLIRFALQEDVNLARARDGGVLLVGDLVRLHTPGDRMASVSDLDPKPFQRAVSVVRASHDLQIRSSRGIQS